MLTYEERLNHIKVLADKKHIGNIFKVDDGVQYFPLFSHKGSKIFETSGACKRWLEEAEESSTPEPVGDIIAQEAISNSKKASKARTLSLEQAQKHLDTIGTYASCMIKATPVLEWMVKYLTVDTTDDEHREEMVNKAKEILTKLKGMTK